MSFVCMGQHDGYRLFGLKMGNGFKVRIIRANLSFSRIRAKFYQLNASLSVILLQLSCQNSNLRSLSLTFSEKKKYMNTDKLAINWQSFAQVRLQLKFALIIRP